jgi:hypothetical protein
MARAVDADSVAPYTPGVMEADAVQSAMLQNGWMPSGTL